MSWIGAELSEWSRGDWLSFGQLLFTVGGFWLAFGQLKRTATAAESTANRIVGLQSRLLGNDLLVLLPDLQKLGDDVDSAVKSGSINDSDSALKVYARAANACSAMIAGKTNHGEDELLKLLDLAVRSAVKAQDEIAKGGSGDVPASARRATSRISSASVEIGATMARLQRKVENDDDA